MVRKNRFGISALSKDNWEDAWDEEIMVNKETGEMIIKSPDGNILSYPHMTRLNNHVDAFSDKINDMGLRGTMFMMVNETKSLPMRIEFGTNILEEPVFIGTGLKQLMVSVSSDTITVNGINPNLIQVPFSYNIDLRDSDDNSIRNFTYTTVYDESLTKILNVSNYDIDYDKAYITDIHLEVDDTYDFESTPINIVHSVLVFIGGAGV